MTRRGIALVLVTVLAAAQAFVTTAPALAIGNDPYCDPGNDCTGFTRHAYDVTEDDTEAVVHVSAAWCCPVGQGQIDYETVNGSAVGGQDFQHVSGTLTYAGGGSGEIRIPISNDTRSEGEEHFEVRLKNYRGTFIDRGYETAIVRIADAPQDLPSQAAVSHAAPKAPASTASAPRAAPASADPGRHRPSSPPSAGPVVVSSEPRPAHDGTVAAEPGDQLQGQPGETSAPAVSTGREPRRRPAWPLVLVVLFGPLLLVALSGPQSRFSRDRTRR